MNSVDKYVNSLLSQLKNDEHCFILISYLKLNKIPIRELVLQMLGPEFSYRFSPYYELMAYTVIYNRLKDGFKRHKNNKYIK